MAFQIKKNGFDNEIATLLCQGYGGGVHSQANPSMVQMHDILDGGGGGGGLVDMPTNEQNISAVNHQSLRNFQTNVMSLIRLLH